MSYSLYCEKLESRSLLAGDLLGGISDGHANAGLHGEIQAGHGGHLNVAASGQSGLEIAGTAISSHVEGKLAGSLGGISDLLKSELPDLLNDSVGASAELNGNLGLSGGAIDLHSDGAGHISANASVVAHGLGISAGADASGDVSGDSHLSVNHGDVSARIDGSLQSRTHFAASADSSGHIGDINAEGSVDADASATAAAGPAEMSVDDSASIDAEVDDSGASATASNDGSAGANIGGADASGSSSADSTLMAPLGALIPATNELPRGLLPGSAAFPFDLNDVLPGLSGSELGSLPSMLGGAPLSNSLFTAPGLSAVEDSGDFVNPDLTGATGSLFGLLPGTDDFFSELGNSTSPVLSAA